MDKTIDLLSLRLDDIEQRLYGYTNISSNNNNNSIIIDENDEQQQITSTPIQQSLNNNINIIQMISNIDKKLRSLTLHNDRFNQCYNELRMLQKWLNDSNNKLEQLDQQQLGNQISIIKFEQILSFEDEIKQQKNYLEEIQELKTKILDDNDRINLLNIPIELQTNLIKLKFQLYEQQQEAKRIDLETKLLIEQFNNWYNNLLKQIQQCSDDITTLECQYDNDKYVD